MDSVENMDLSLAPRNNAQSTSRTTNPRDPSAQPAQQGAHIMENQELFKKLTANVSIGREHKSFFKYNDEVCKIVCSSFPATDEDFYLESIETDSDGVPYESRPLLDVYEDKLTILVEHTL